MLALAVVSWWGFAFWPVPAGDTSWLSAAQSACFGSLPGGPPAVQGWMMLVPAPLLMLAAIGAAFHGELRTALPRLARSPLAHGIAAACVLVFMVEVRWAAGRIREQRRVATVSFAPEERGPLPDNWPRSSDPVPAFTLVDQHGGAFGAADLRGRPTVLSFAFANCQTVCPVLVANLGRAARELGPGGARIALVTLDPWRDTPGALPALASRWSLPEDGRLLSGDPDAVCRLLDTLRVAHERDLKSGDVSHAPIVMILDAEGRIAYRFNNPPPEWIVEGVRRVRGRS